MKVEQSLEIKLFENGECVLGAQYNWLGEIGEEELKEILSRCTKKFFELKKKETTNETD